jgi:hypothetical protein
MFLTVWCGLILLSEACTVVRDASRPVCEKSINSLRNSELQRCHIFIQFTNNSTTAITVHVIFSLSKFRVSRHSLFLWVKVRPALKADKLAAIC